MSSYSSVQGRAYYVVVLKGFGLSKFWHEIAYGPFQTYQDADEYAAETNEMMEGGDLGNCFQAAAMADRKDGRPWRKGDHIELKYIGDDSTALGVCAQGV